MKELSIKEKAKRYDEAIERAKECHIDGLSLHQPVKDVIEHIFPELKESEDERIRKWLIGYFQRNKITENIKTHDIIAWLEKQVEHKHVDEPKFKVGDWIVDGIDTVYQINEIKEDVYLLQFYNSSDIISLKISTIDNDCHLWTIEDAKDGNVLVTEPINGYPSPFIAIYKERGLDFFNSYCFVGFDGKFYEADTGHSTEEIHPATKEQRELLFKKMYEASYEWDAEKKELNKIEKNSFESDRVEKAMHEAGYEWSKETHQLKKIEQNLTWSEEDEQCLLTIQKIICDSDTSASLANKLSNWLKSLKYRGQPQPKQEWNEEDERNLKGIIDEIESNKNFAPASDLVTYDRYLSWIKSLKERYTWKPSDEQLDALHDAAMYVDKSMFPYPKGILMKLHKQLKKLREE